ncbi:hypothetical protein S40293_05935 [Stachybotrys chartarum IBT 40293]|nr:hypothetical protein S40293_05935 [Stachybotrys chartarum IBT 40293]
MSCSCLSSLSPQPVLLLKSHLCGYVGRDPQDNRMAANTEDGGFGLFKRPNRDQRPRWLISLRRKTAGNEELGRLLIDEGAILDLGNQDKKTALHHASSCGHKETLTLLIDRKADLEKGDKRGLTAVHHASSKGHEEVVRLLVDRGATVEKSDLDGMTALDHAWKNKHKGAMKLLIDIMVLEYSVHHNYEAAMRLLMDGGAKLASLYCKD